MNFEDDNAVLDKVTVDIPKRRFTLLGSDGQLKTIDCDDGDQFMRILELIRELCLNDEVVYV
jgi:hypothetical protein|tara:strand:- start:670 stop:855 length:186 start_codon:yes stop_codon:yes gene_type:complete